MSTHPAADSPMPLTEEQVSAWGRRIRQETFANYHYEMGVALAQAGQQADAIAAFHRAIDEQPDLFAAHSDLIDTLRALGRNADAEAAERQALAIDARFAVKALRRRAAARLQADDPATAADLLLVVANAVPEWREELSEELGDAGKHLFEHGNFARATEVLETALSLAPEPSQKIVLMAGRSWFRLGQWDKAEQMYRLILARNEDNAETYYSLAWVQVAKGDVRSALALVRRALDLGMPLSEFAHLLMGNLLHILGDEDGAAQACELAARNPSLAGMVTSLRMLRALARGGEAEARHVMRQPDDRHPMVASTLALVEWTAGQREKALAQAAAATNSAPPAPWALLVEGILMRATGAPAAEDRIAAARRLDDALTHQNAQLIARSVPALVPLLGDLLPQQGTANP